MRRTWDVFGKGIRPGKGSATPHILSSVLIVSFMVLGALTIKFWKEVENLGQLTQTSPEVLAALIPALQHDSDPDVRSRALESLAQLEQSLLLPA